MHNNLNKIGDVIQMKHIPAKLTVFNMQIYLQNPLHFLTPDKYSQRCLETYMYISMTGYM